jgi:hypothetical protein
MHYIIYALIFQFIKEYNYYYYIKLASYINTSTAPRKGLHVVTPRNRETTYGVWIGNRSY